MTNIVVGKDRIHLSESERYVAGTKNAYFIKVSFSEDWEGMKKSLRFKTDCTEIEVDLLDCSEKFPIPSELFVVPSNHFWVGASGRKCDNLALNTSWLSLGRIAKGTTSSDCCCNSSVESRPSPGTYEYLQNLISERADRVTFENGSLLLWAGDILLSSVDIPTFSSTVVAGNVPVGVIQVWSGDLDDIPESYSLCDGQNGTPDLRSAMIIGASDETPPGTSFDLPPFRWPRRCFLPLTATRKYSWSAGTARTRRT